MSRGRRSLYKQAALCVAAAALLLGTAGMQITDLKVPPAVRNGSSFAVLDCEYTLKPEEQNNNTGLVIKWFFNNGPEPVYQWIPFQRPQDLGVLKGRLNLDYKASSNKYYMHRALCIANPTTDLTGHYKCSVSTFKDEDFMIKKMVVFEPGRDIDFRWEKSWPDDAVRLSCSVRGVFPEPKLSILEEKSKKVRHEVPGVSTNTSPRLDGSSFDVHVSVMLRDTELATPSMFQCDMRIPDTNYASKKWLLYHPGAAATTLTERVRVLRLVLPLLTLLPTCC